MSSACGQVVTPNSRSGRSASPLTTRRSRLPCANGRITITPMIATLEYRRDACVALERLGLDLDVPR